MQSGILHCEEKDYKTSFSYFFEAFEGYHSLSDGLAILCLKYMLLCKIMSNETDDINNILTSKNPIKYSKFEEIISIKEVSLAYHNRSLFDFEKALNDHKVHLKDDTLISHHISELYENLLEQHLLRIIEPFSRVQISHIAKLIGLDKSRIEKKLSQMILDKKLLGILDQGNDCLIVFFEEKDEELYPYAIETVQNLNEVVESLFETCQKLTQ
jgi:26S proteasome regulatory subunit N6